MKDKVIVVTGEVWYLDVSGCYFPVPKELAHKYTIDSVNKEEYDKYSLQTLRQIARNVGVKAPTVMCKEELINAIISVSTGKIKPIDTQYKMGRPPIDDKMSEFKFFSFEKGKNSPEDEEFLDRPLNIRTGEEYVGFSGVACPPMTYNDDNYTKEIREGYLEVIPPGYGKIRVDGYKESDKDICISQFLVNKYKLRTGQYVKGRCKKFIYNKPEIMYDVLGVEGQAINDEDIVFFENLDYLAPSVNINFSNIVLDFEILKGITVENIKFGGKYFVKNIDKLNIIEKTNAFVKTIANNNNAKLLYIQACARPEEKAINANNIECIRIPYGEVAKQAKTIINMIWEKAKRMLECGENVILVMSNYTEILKIFNRAVTGHVNVPISTEAWDIFKNSIELAKKAINGGSITMIAFDNLLLSSDQMDFVSTELLPYFDKHFEI